MSEINEHYHKTLRVKQLVNQMPQEWTSISELAKKAFLSHHSLAQLLRPYVHNGTVQRRNI